MLNIMMRKKKPMKKTAAKKKPMYGKGTAKTPTKKSAQAKKLMGRGIPEPVVKKMLGTMDKGGMTTGQVMKKYGYGGTSMTRNMKKK